MSHEMRTAVLGTGEYQTEMEPKAGMHISKK